jgi:hypothetical protein
MDDMTGYLVGWFLILMLEGRDFPMLVGPYPSKYACMDVEEVYQLKGYMTAGCTIMNIPTEIEKPPL